MRDFLLTTKSVLADSSSCIFEPRLALRAVLQAEESPIKIIKILGGWANVPALS